MGIGNFTDIVGNDDAISESLRILSMFINSTPLSKNIIHKFSWVFWPNIISDYLFFKTSFNTSWVLFKCDFLMLEREVRIKLDTSLILVSNTVLKLLLNSCGKNLQKPLWRHPRLILLRFLGNNVIFLPHYCVHF